MAPLKITEKLKRQITFSSPGMTLIEIIVVIALVGLLLSLGVSVLTDWFEDNLSKTASELSGTIRYTYNESAIKNRPYRLKIDFGSQTISVEASSEDVKIETELEASSENEKLSNTHRYWSNERRRVSDLHPPLF